MANLVKEKIITFTMYSKLFNCTLVALIFGCIISYIYFANVAVRTLSILEKSKREMQSLSVEVSEMEGKRLAVDNSVGNVLAQRLGFVEVVDHTFIVNKPKTSLSFKVD